MKEKIRLWVLDSHEEALRLYREAFREEFEVEYFRRRAELLSAIERARFRPDLLVTELRLPDGELDETCMERCRKATIPFVIVCQADDSRAFSRAFDGGASDILVKPVRESVLRFKIRKSVEECVRRTQYVRSDFADVSLDAFDQKIRRGGFSRPIRLTPTEFKIMSLFFTRSDSRVQRSAIIARVWGAATITEKVFDFHLFQLRGKLKDLELKIEFAKEGYRLLYSR